MSNNSIYDERLNKCYEYLRNQGNINTEDFNVTLLKGGAYSIKQYYLENNKLDDIRGASAILAYVEETLIPGIIEKEYDKSCIIYNGGGNVFCVLPESVTEDFSLRLEEEASKYLISANVAFVVRKARWSDIANDDAKYKTTMRDLETELSERKKLKLTVSINSENTFVDSGIPWNGKILPIDVKKCDGGVCAKCCSRNAKYTDNKYKICASCLNKIIVGKEMKTSWYAQEYKKYTNKYAEEIKSLADKNRIAVIYGDGNNMGQAIANFTKITEMMEFSERVKDVTKKCVYESLSECNENAFEIVGLGGDDIFIIVSGEKATEISVKIIEKYNKAMEDYKSTISVGICIAKHDIPIKIMLEQAEEKLDEAKNQSKRDRALGTDNGTVAITVLDDATDSSEKITNKFDAKMTLQPFGLKAAKQFIEYIRELKKNKGKTSIRNIYDAYMISDSAEEAELFLKYQNARMGDKANILPPELDGYNLSNGLYSRNGKDEEKMVIWRDVIELYKYIGGQEVSGK